MKKYKRPELTNIGKLEDLTTGGSGKKENPHNPRTVNDKKVAKAAKGHEIKYVQ